MGVMKKLFEEDDHEQDKMERARILMAVIPVVLILLILAFMLIKSRSRIKAQLRLFLLSLKMIWFSHHQNDETGSELSWPTVRSARAYYKIAAAKPIAENKLHRQ